MNVDFNPPLDAVAADVAQALAEKKYRTRVGGNADNFDFATSAVYYADGFRDPAQDGVAHAGNLQNSHGLSMGV